ncbi:MAG: holotricin-3 [Eggerthellaceae bacterium]|nr:holotricin-3 [Eggerthellaceae bacterium]
MASEPSGRRAGDWTHKSQRTHDQANTIIKDPGAKKWYQDTFWIIFFLVILWPVGVVLMWRSDWHIAVKVIVSVLLAGVVYLSFSMWSAVQASMGA